MPKLTCKTVRFYSQADEWAFFQFAQHIPAVQKLVGEGDALLIHVRARPSDQNLRDLIGLFSRYGIGGASQLARFRHAGNEAWFAAPGTYWHKKYLARKTFKARGRVRTGNFRRPAPP